MYNIHTHRVVFELCVMEKKIQNSKKDEQNLNFHV